MRSSRVVSGVQGLGSVIKKDYPDLISTYNRRWKDPRIQGKTVALDATLLTTRFFYTQLDDELMESKKLIIAWHRLISKMREAGVKPIAIFDEPGPRDWKMREHVKRQNARSLMLSRSIFEDERKARLVKLQEAIEETKRISASGLPLANIASTDLQHEIDRMDDDDEEAFLSEEDAMAQEIEALEQIDLDEKVESGKEAEPDSETRTNIDVEPGKAVLRDTLRLIRDCEASARPSEKAKHRSWLDVSVQHSLEAERLEEDAEDLGPALSGAELLGSIFQSNKNKEDDSVTPVSDEAASIDVSTLVDDDGTEGLSTIAVPPLTDFRETARQTSLTGDETQILTRLVDALVSPSPIQTSTLTQIEQDVQDLSERAKVIAKVYDRSHTKPTATDMMEAMELLEVMGVPTIQASSPYEAEGLCSAMTLSGMADFAGTEDSDVLVYGALLLKNVATGALPLQTIDGDALRSKLEMTPTQYQDFLILNGTDACERIHGIGFKRALKLIHEYKTIEGILQYGHSKKVLIGSLIGEGYMDRVESARKVFAELPPLPTNEQVAGRPFDADAVAAFMREKHGLEVSSAVFEDEKEFEESFAQFERPQEGEYKEGEFEMMRLEDDVLEETIARYGNRAD